MGQAKMVVIEKAFSYYKTRLIIGEMVFHIKKRLASTQYRICSLSAISVLAGILVPTEIPV